MKHNYLLLLVFLAMYACQPPVEKIDEETTEAVFQYSTEQFADLKIYRYQIPGFDQLTLDQKKLVYYLSQAGLSGRDIIYDQNYRHNLTIRLVLEHIVKNYNGDKETDNWQAFMTYTKRVWFANGIHHHYSMNKIMPEFSSEYFDSLLGETEQNLNEEVLNAMFNPDIDNKKVNLDESKGLLLGSATNFYGPDVSAAEVEEYYNEIVDNNTSMPIAYGLNSKVIKNEDGQLEEVVWKSGGMYGEAIDQIIFWLEKASTVAENDEQKRGFELLIKYYQTGDLKVWDEYNIVWAKATKGDIDYINSFIEVYNDPIGYRGSFESIVEITDFEASKRMQVLSENVQWFEDNSPIMDEHKKANVVGVSYKVVNVASESGDASPATPIGVNLPNSDWIRKEHGSKSVSLGNIIEAYKNGGSSGMLAEFAYSEDEIARVKKYGSIGDKMHTALHEVIGHASGQLNPGIGTPKQTLKSYASTLEEGRADLVGLYYLMDPKLVELGLIPSIEVGKSEYDSYIRNGLMMQLRRIDLGQEIEEAHMRNRAWVSAWSYEQGKADNVIERKVEEGKTYFVVNDYDKLRAIFGELLKETQRIKSEGDFDAVKNLVENYGVKIDPVLHQEVLTRSEPLKSAPYGGFINPVLTPTMDPSGNITEVTVEYMDDFSKQMLYYADNYSFLAK
ncbi:MAG: dipeptidyl peptidase 3 [Reichenbachiella sp.]